MGFEIDEAPCVLPSRFVDQEEFITIKGTVDVRNNAGLRLKVYIDGKAVDGMQIQDRTWEVASKVTSLWLDRQEEEGTPPTRQTMVLGLACGNSGGATCHLAFC
jgi:hypothetical protein